MRFTLAARADSSMQTSQRIRTEHLVVVELSELADLVREPESDPFADRPFADQSGVERARFHSHGGATAPRRARRSRRCSADRRDQPTRDRGGGRASSSCTLAVISRMAGRDGRSLDRPGPAAGRDGDRHRLLDRRVRLWLSRNPGRRGSRGPSRCHGGARGHDLVGRVVGDRGGGGARLAASRPTGCCLRPVVASAARGHDGSRHAVG